MSSIHNGPLHCLEDNQVNDTYYHKRNVLKLTKHPNYTRMKEIQKKKQKKKKVYFRGR